MLIVPLPLGISVFDHFIINRGDNSYHGGSGKLFSAGIMDSGSAVPTGDADTPAAQAVYDQVVEAAGCSTNQQTLDCLRNLDYDTMLKAATSAPNLLGYRGLDLAYLPRPDPNDDFFPVSPDTLVGSTGEGFVHAPAIIGDQQDEGSIFSLFTTNISTTSEVVDYLQTYFPVADRSIVQGLVDTYPDDPAAGCPYGTGQDYNLYPQMKRLNAILGDAVFILPRRIVLSILSQTSSVWSYLATYNQGVPFVGTFHFSDVLEIFLGFPNKYPQEAALNYYISFVNFHDPNQLLDHLTSPGLTSPLPQKLQEWPQWKNDTRTLLNLQARNSSLMTDNFRSDSYNQILANAAKLRV